MTGVADGGGGGGGDHYSSNLVYGDQGFTNSPHYLKNSAAEICHTAPPPSLQPTGSLQGGGWRVKGGGEGGWGGQTKQALVYGARYGGR